MNMTPSQLCYFIAGLLVISLLFKTVVCIPARYGFHTDAQNEDRGKGLYEIASKPEVQSSCSDSHPSCKGYTPDPTCCRNFPHAMTSAWKTLHPIDEESKNNSTSSGYNADVIMNWGFVLTFTSVVAIWLLE